MNLDSLQTGLNSLDKFQYNRVRGFVGDDYLEGGKGNNNIKGGKGADTFAFKSLDGSIDVIKNFYFVEGDRFEVFLADFTNSLRDNFR